MIVEDGDLIELTPARPAAGRGRAGVRDGDRPGRAGRDHRRRAAAPSPGRCRRSRSWTAGWPTGRSSWSTRSPTTPRPGCWCVGGRMRPVADLDLRLLGVAVSRHGELIDTGAGAAALGNPARCVAWLANKLGSFGDGSARRATSCCPARCTRWCRCSPGDVFRAEFAHLGAGHRPVLERRRRDVSIDGAQEIADVLIDAERERKGSRSSATTTRTSRRRHRVPRRSRPSSSPSWTPGRRFVGYKLGPDQPQQAAGHGRGRAALRSGDQRHALHLRRPGAARPVHPPAGGVGDRVPAGPRRRGAGHRRPPCWPPPTWCSARSTCSTPGTRASSSRWPTSSPTTPAPARSTSARSRGGRTSWWTCACSAAWCGWTARWP